MHPRRHLVRPVRHRLGIAAVALAGLVLSGCSLVSVETPLAELLPASTPSASGESVDGPRLEPPTLLTARELGSDFLTYSSMHRPLYGRDGMFVIVAPMEEATLAA